MTGGAAHLRASEWVGGPEGAFRVLDQTALPGAEIFIDLKSPGEVVDALRRLAVRGAPLIGVAGAYAVHLGARGIEGDRARFTAGLDAVAAEVAAARPTAVNLAWAVGRVVAAARASGPDPAAQKAALFEAARALDADDRARCDAMARHGVGLVADGERLLTHCNSGALATAGVGTALGVILEAARTRRGVTVYADETRPLLQGARLTMWELLRAGVKATLLCDGAAGELLRRRGVDRILVGADRIAANGDAANKIGTYPLAVLAKRHGVPFHFVAPISTIDASIPDGDSIPIEERDPEEVLSFAGVRTAPDGASAFAPAFDVTPAELVTSYVTERGIFRADEIAALPFMTT